MSKMRIFVAFAVVVGLALAVPVFGQETQAQQPKADQAQPNAQPQEGTLKLTVKYAGSEGTVDQTHKIWVFVFDTPEFSSGQVMPLRYESIAENGGTFTFTFTIPAVYLAVAFDKQGGYEMSGPPPSGTPLGIYMTGETQGPSPIKIESGKTTEIQMQFDDSIKMP
ncbi:MAG: hypothetical protein EHM61_18080 [Acidobacteria bacterium]|nr:MAG: hypothetical protein EHM61_18080 [Acidobacteriota bacterium]